MDALPLDPKTVRLLQSELHDGESVQWASSPLTEAIVFRSLYWIGLLTLVGMVPVFVASSSGANETIIYTLLFSCPVFTALFGVVCATVSAHRMAYVITNLRAIVLERTPIGPNRIYSFGPNQLHLATKVRHSDGRGDILLGTVASGGKAGPSKMLIGFFGLTDANPPFVLLEALQRGTPSMATAVPPQYFSWTQLIVPTIPAVLGILALLHSSDLRSGFGPSASIAAGFALLTLAACIGASRLQNNWPART